MKITEGQKFGRLTAYKYLLGSIWQCVCDCGVEHKARTSRLLSGRVKSCGCLMREARKTNNLQHGLDGSPTHISWKCMWKRCTYEKSKDFHLYKTRKPPEAWRSFEQFHKDMGDRPIGKTLDRIDNSKPYGPENCRWATPLEQSRNK